jgi:hypothetical protein
VALGSQVFHEALIVAHWRAPDVLPKINRVINILEERQTYSANACARWRRLLHSPPADTNYLATPKPLGAKEEAASAPKDDSSALDDMGLPKHPDAAARVAVSTLKEILTDVDFRNRVTTAVAKRVQHVRSDFIDGSLDLGGLARIPPAQRRAEVTAALRACAILSRLVFCAEETREVNRAVKGRLDTEVRSCTETVESLESELSKAKEALERLDALEYLAGTTSGGTVVSVAAADGGSSSTPSAFATAMAAGVDAIEDDEDEGFQFGGALTSASSGSAGEGEGGSEFNLLDEDEPAATEGTAESRPSKRARDADEMGGMVYNPIAREYQPANELSMNEDWRD